MPRKIGNLANLPLPLYNALAADTYSAGDSDISATRIIAPPRIVTLRKFHEDEILEDASDRVWSLLGSSVHRMLELSAGDGILVEQRLTMPVEGRQLPTGPQIWKVSAQPDVYIPKTGILYDYKVTSVWSVLFGDKPEWERQVNIQAMLHRHHRQPVNEGYIVAIMRDWQVRKAKLEKDYPQVALKPIAIPLWSQSDIFDFTVDRVKVHQQVQADYIESGMDANVLPLCTPEERWYRGAKIAVKKMDTKSGKVNKKADRLFDDMPSAEQFMRDNAASLPKGKVWAKPEERTGENIRCMDYCDVNQFCPFYKNLVRQMAEQATNEGPQSDLFPEE